MKQDVGLRKSTLLPVLSVALALGLVSNAHAQDQSAKGSNWYSGNWSLTIGAAGMVGPDFEGSQKYILSAVPLVSFGRQGTVTRFSSRNDNISFGLIDTGDFRAGLVGKLLLPRDSSDYRGLEGLHDVKFGGEAGLFAEFYPTDWLRMRGEVRRGIRTHNGYVGDLAIDAFTDVTPRIRISGGPRLSAASSDYFKAYYGVSNAESLTSGLSPYSPGGGFRSVGVGGAITWKTTDKVTTSLFAEYARLLGPAADSSLVRERGSADQFLVGLSATYRFDFTVP
jgi:outer membrane scaffolding protein for murein synthesis (MipA/OmpV family)